MKTKMKWDLDKCIKVAREYKTISEFKKANKSAYNNVIKYQWKNQVFKHMISLRDLSKAHINYNFKTCKQEALKYNNRSEFHEKAHKAYVYARKQNILDKVCSHMISPKDMQKKAQTIWTLDNCQAEALKFKSRKEFGRKSSSAYQRAIKEGYLDQICKHMTPTKELRSQVLTKYSFEKCKQEALKYKTKSEFRKKSRPMYEKSMVNKWIDQICDHMKVEVVKKVSGKTIKTRQFSPKEPQKWTYEKCLNTALKYKKKSDFIKFHPGGYHSAIRNGWLDKIFSHTMSKGDAISETRTFWTKSKCKKEALKYKSRSVFGRKSNGAYTRALKSGWLDEICQHMTPANQKWTVKTLQKEALKYKTRTEFKTKSGGAYAVASNKGHLAKICTHMPQMSGVDLSKHEYNAVHKPTIKIIESLGYTYKKEYRLAKNSIVDLIIFHPKLSYNIALELKRSDILSLEPNQISRYKKYANLKQHNIKYLFFVDPQGKHHKKGFISFADLKEKLKKILNRSKK